MTTASVAVIVRKFPEISVGALLGVVVVQGFGYGLIFDLNFFLRNLSVIGGLLMVLSDSLSKKKTIFAGLPSISETDRKIYFQVSLMLSCVRTLSDRDPFLQLAGRVLLIFLFIGFIIQGNWSIARVLVSILGFGACVMVAVGFKARWSASFLVLLLSVFNVSLRAYVDPSTAADQLFFIVPDLCQQLLDCSCCPPCPRLLEVSDEVIEICRVHV